MSDKHGGFSVMNSTRKFKLMQTSRGALSTGLDTSSVHGLPGISSVHGNNRNGMAQLQYANIDLFKIPDVYFKKIKKNTSINEEDPSNGLDSRFEIWGQSLDNNGEDPDLIVKQAVEEAKLNHISRKAKSLFQTTRPSVYQGFDTLGKKAFTTTLNFPDVKPLSNKRASAFDAPDQAKSYTVRPTLDMQDFSQTGKSFHRGSTNKRSPKSKMQDLENAPVIHMQFDLAASDALGETYANQFKKLSQVARRDPVKYTRNPDKVFGQTLGALKYTWRDSAKQTTSPASTARNFEATSSQMKTVTFIDPSNIKVSRTQAREVSDPSQFVKHFTGSQEDREKQTQILDFIIQSKKTKEKMKRQAAEMRKEAEEQVLLAFLDKEKPESVNCSSDSGSLDDD